MQTALATITAHDGLLVLQPILDSDASYMAYKEDFMIVFINAAV